MTKQRNDHSKSKSSKRDHRSRNQEERKDRRRLDRLEGREMDAKQEQQKTQTVIPKSVLLQLGASQQMKKIQEFFQMIQVAPQNNFKYLDNIFTFCKASNVRVATTALRTLAQIFISVAPLQAVNLKELEQRRGVTVTKQQFSVLRFEQLLVHQYQRYLSMLKQLNSKITHNNFNADQQLFLQFKKCLLHCIAKCYRSLWHFNHFKILNQLALKFIKHSQCRAFMQQILAGQNLATLKAKQIILTSLGNLIKDKSQGQLPDELIQLANSTYIDSRYLQKDKEAMDFRKKKMKKKLYRQQQLQKKKDRQNRKGQKLQRGTLEMKQKIKQDKAKQKMRVRQEVNKQFAEGEVELKKKELVKGNSALLQQLFYVYFKILVERTNSKYMRDCLQGVLAYAHLINIDLVSGLIGRLDAAAQNLRQLWLINKQDTVLTNRLSLVFTSYSLLNGPLSVFSMDDLRATTNFYKILKDVNNHKEKLNMQHFRVIGMTTEESLIRRRQLSHQVVGSLLRQLSFFLLKQQIPKNYLLQLVRQIASKYSRVGKMFQPDNQGFGLNGYNPQSLDPQCSNAINTQIITNFQQLLQNAKKNKKQYSQIVQRFSRLNFNRPQGIPSLEHFIKMDLQTFDNQV